MEPRIDYPKGAPGVYEAMDGLEKYLKHCGLKKSLIDLIKLRASQINGCAYCIDSHWKDLRAVGETEQRLYGLDAWEESPYYTDRERAALAWTGYSTSSIDRGQSWRSRRDKARSASSRPPVWHRAQ